MMHRALMAEAFDTYLRVKSQVELNRGEHAEQVKQVTKVDTDSLKGIGDTVTGMLGAATNHFFNPLPPLDIWLKAETLLISANASLTRGDVLRATADVTDARFAMLVALAKYKKWKGDLDAARTKMSAAIVVSAFALVAVTFGLMAAAPAAIAAGRAFLAVLAEYATAARGTTTAAKSISTLATTVAAAEEKFRIAEVAIEELEQAAAEVEQATRALRR